ncbi:MAG TPA: hypothetical protein VLM89_15545 [Phycisphaerae bacterium]|nr:hypothetical protein [Phycisphaerae bacterium]
MKHIPEHDELLLGRLLDDDLSPVEAAALRERIQREPDLQEACHALTRIHAALIERRKDTCRVDWPRFHDRVMDRVAAEADAPAPVIRFPSWLKVAMPFAAAAAIALVVVLRGSPPGTPTTPAGHGPPQVAYHAPPPVKAAGALVVHFHRPDLKPVNPARATIHVAYAHSDELQEYYRRADEARRDQPSSHLYIMHAEGAGTVDLMEEPPL